ncbi:rho GTPase activating protein at 19D isoform X3 [Arctopsyche grandis]|uniref:rho GTPase activating protein at 19D isoform X3 n=1 Tax=Arctopsyche grandis TaxID=121162 RepID=UPI00406D902F
MAEGGARAPLVPLRHHRQQQAALGNAACAPPLRPAVAPHPPLGIPTHQSLVAPAPAPAPLLLVPPTPRILVLRRADGHGFGFTLRHFIIYPPESVSDLLCDGRHAAVGAIRECMDTIFVKSVREGGAAQRAGLRPGDRLLAVDGHHITGWPYATVVQLIQQAPRTLRLQVVPKEADVLQRYFSEAAYNPETNQRPRSRTRERRTSTGEMPLGLGVGTGVSTSAHPLYVAPLNYRPVNTNNAKISNEYPLSADLQNRLKAEQKKSAQSYNSSIGSSRADSSDRVFTNIPIENLNRGAIPRKAEAQPQVPPQPTNLQKNSRRSSEGARLAIDPSDYYASPPSSPFNSSRDSTSVYTSGESIQSSHKNQMHLLKSTPTHISHLNQNLPNNNKLVQYGSNPDNVPMQYTNKFDFDDRRESNASLTSSAAESKDSLSSYESISTLTGNDPDNILYKYRIRKSLEQKEAFLRRPSQPTGWATPEQNVIQQKEFYARPQKLHKPAWPPGMPSDYWPSKNKENIQDNGARTVHNPADYEKVNNLSANQSSDMSGASKVDFNKPSSSKQKHEKGAFHTTLSKIQENTPVFNDSGGNLTNGSQASSNSLEMMLQEKRYQIPSELQIVSNRTRQFESLPSEDRTALYKSELARLSTKKPEPTVALRRKEFESRGGKRDARSLEAQQSSEDNEMVETNLSGNRMMLTGSKHLTCPPPDDYEEIEKRHVRLRSNSTGSEGLPTRRSHAPGVSMDDAVVLRRHKNAAQLGEEERAMRRVSYLKATWGDHLHFDSDHEFSDSEHQALRTEKKEREEYHHDADRTIHEDLESAEITMRGSVQIKMVLNNGKRASDRSWKQAWALLQGPKLTLYRHQHQSPTAGGSSESLNLRFSMADLAGDYTKRKHVVRVTSISGAELLLQAGSADEASHWLTALRAQAPRDQIVETQKPLDSPAEASGLSPPPRTKKHANTRTVSPTENTSVSLTASPKSKTWKGRVARQLRRMQAGGAGTSPVGTPNSISSMNSRMNGAVGIPLERCESLPSHPLVPHLVGLCTRAVEERGLHVVGVYRVPGNTASVTALMESLERSPTPDSQDPRWNDVNVVSSLLKAFFRRLPNPLLTKDLYPLFISADKITERSTRVHAIRKLVRELPDHHYETLKFLMEHLRRVASENSVNKMEPRNLAIVFGPTLVRSADDDMITMVNDMSSQCRIIESLINDMEWYFDEEDRRSPVNDIPCDEESLPSTTSNQALLLQNVKKIEGKLDVSTKDIVSSIISAANRKIQRKPRSKGNNINREVNNTNNSKLRETCEKVIISPDEQQPEQPPGVVLTTISPPPDNDNFPIKTYAGLEQNTQERIKRFEMETRAMLRREKKPNDWQNSPRQETSSPITIVENNNTDAQSAVSDASGRSNPCVSESRIVGKRLKTDSTLSSDSFSDGVVDMVSSLTSTFDQKLRSLHNSSPLDDPNIPYADEGHDDSQDFGDPSLHRSSEVSSLKDDTISKNSEEKNKSESSSMKSANSGSQEIINLMSSKKYAMNVHSDKNGSVKLMQKTSVSESPMKESNLGKYSNVEVNGKSKTKSVEVDSDCEKDVDINSEQSSPDDVTPDNNRSAEKFSFSEKSFHDPKTICDNKTLVDHKVTESTIKNTLQDIFFKKSSFNQDKTDIMNSTLIVKNKLKRSESLNRETEKQMVKNNKLIISENCNKSNGNETIADAEKSSSPKLTRSVSLNRSSDVKLKWSDNLTKNEKTETNISRRREINYGGLNRASAKLKRKNGMPERSIKRRHTVGGTKDFDKDEWVALSCSRTSSPDLPTTIIDLPIHPHISSVPLESHV